MDELSQAAETQADFGTGEKGEVRRFIAEIEAYEKEAKNWHTRADKVVKRYLDERPDSDTERRFNILWSNVETLKPAVYASTPKPEVSRRFKDRDPVARLASMILERALSYSLDEYDFDGVMQSAVQDRLLPGRGTAWARYDYQEGADDYTERAVCDYVHWKDFGHTPARVWSEVETVWRRVYLTRRQLKKRFGQVGAKVPLDHKPKNTREDNRDSPEHEVFSKATVYEMWHKPSKTVRWVNKSYKDGFLDKKEDPLGLKGFFPCPRPLFGTTSTKSLIPTPDYSMYQDQAEEIDELTARIGSLQSSLKVVGVYDSSAEGVQRMLNEGVENTLVPVDSWAAFAEKGGLDGAVDFMPLDQIVGALAAAYEARERVKQELYEVTGLSDILRGASDAQETATAQGIKAQWGSQRVRDKQKDVQRFARDIIRIKGEIIAEHFSPETLAAMVNADDLIKPPQDMPPEEANQYREQQFMQAIELLRNDRLRGFLVDIETDSTIEPDEQAEKEARVEFISAASGFLKNAIEVVQISPELTPMMSEMMLFGVRGFKAGRQMEQVIEENLEKAGNAAMQRMQQQAQQPNPDMVKAEADKARIENDRMKMQMEAQKAQTEAAYRQQEMMLKEREADQKDAEIRIKEREVEAQNQISIGDLNLKSQAQAQQMELEREKMAVEREEKAMDREARRDEMRERSQPGE